MGFKVYNKTSTKPYLFHDVPPVTIEPMINAHKNLWLKLAHASGDLSGFVSNPQVTGKS